MSCPGVNGSFGAQLWNYLPSELLSLSQTPQASLLDLPKCSQARVGNPNTHRLEFEHFTNTFPPLLWYFIIALA